MMNLSMLLASAAALLSYAAHDTLPASQPYPLPEGKAIYQPEEFAGQDWQADTCRYSYARMDYTENTVVFWEKGFGKDLANPPQLDGHDMRIDLKRLKTKLEEFYTFFRDSLDFVNPGSYCERYRMMVMLMYSLDGTAYGGAYDNKIGAFWAAPNRLQDPNLNAVAHELGHSFQLQMLADGSSCWGEKQGGFFEMTSQWMLWQVNPNWIAEETYHWDAFKQASHKAFLHDENVYRSPYVLEYWSERNGLDFIAKLYRESTADEDPVLTYQRLKGFKEGENYKFVDEMFDCYCHLVNLDFKRAFAETRPFANSFENFQPYMTQEPDGYWQIKAERCPENYGFNAIRLEVPEPGTTVKADFKGLQGKEAPAGYLGYKNPLHETAYYRYGLVGVTEEGETLFGTSGSTDADNPAGTVSWTVPEGKKLAHLWLIVTAGPHDTHRLLQQVPLAQWPYKVKLTNTRIL